MPLIPAAKGIIILTPILLAAGYAVYDSHPPFRNFVDEQWRRFQDFAEEQGWRDREREPMSFGGSGLWDPAEGIGLRDRQRRSRASSDSSDSSNRHNEDRHGQTTATDLDAAAGVSRRQTRPFRETASEMPEDQRGLDRLAALSAADHAQTQEVDTASEWSRHSTDAVLTPTTEEGASVFGDGNGTDYGFDSATAQSDARSDTTETATDADMLSSVGSETMHSELDASGEEDAMSVASSWSDVGSEVSFDSTQQ